MLKILFIVFPLLLSTIPLIPNAYAFNCSPQTSLNQAGPTGSTLSFEIFCSDGTFGQSVDQVDMSLNCSGPSLVQTNNLATGAPHTFVIDITGFVPNVTTCSAVVTSTSPFPLQQHNDNFQLTAQFIDTIPPMALCNDATIPLDSNGQASITPVDIDGGSSDDVGIQSLSVSPSSFNCNNLGPNISTLTVTDTSGNVAICQAIVTVEDPLGACSSNQVVGGEIIPIETISLILAGTQSFSWMIPLVMSAIGFGLFVIRRSENS